MPFSFSVSVNSEHSKGRNQYSSLGLFEWQTPFMAPAVVKRFLYMHHNFTDQTAQQCHINGKGTGPALALINKTC